MSESPSARWMYWITSLESLNTSLRNRWKRGHEAAALKRTPVALVIKSSDTDRDDAGRFAVCDDTVLDAQQERVGIPPTSVHGYRGVGLGRGSPSP